jgi:hypothetical protein
MPFKRSRNPDRANEVLQEMVAGMITAEDGVSELWCMADWLETWHEHVTYVFSSFKYYGLTWEESDHEAGELDQEQFREEVVAFARTILEAGGVFEYEQRLEEGVGA